jgi:hypothetical protein
VLATKFVNPCGPAPTSSGQSRKWIIQVGGGEPPPARTPIISTCSISTAPLFDAPLDEGRARDRRPDHGRGSCAIIGVSNFMRLAHRRDMSRLADQFGIDRPIVEPAAL